MTEFYTDLSEEEVNALIAKKLEIYNDEPPYILKFPPVLWDHDFIYQAYARSHKKEIGSFDLWRYTAIAEGYDLYSFFVERPATEENANIIKERKNERIRRLNKGQIKRKYEKMSNNDLENALKEKGLLKVMPKKDKVQCLVEHDLEKLIE